MHYALLVRGLHRLADGDEELQPRLELETTRAAVDVDRLALDELHNEIGMPALGRAAVVEPRDGRVIQRGEDLPLLLEAPQHVLGIGPRLDELHGYALLERTVVALAEVDHRHPAAADLAHDPIDPNALRRRNRRIVLH